MRLATAFLQTAWWAVISSVVLPFVFMLLGLLLAQWLAEHRGRVLVKRKRAPVPHVNPLLSSSPHASSTPLCEPLSLAEVAEERSQRKSAPVASPANNQRDWILMALIAVVPTFAYLSVGDLVRVLIGILGAIGIGYASGRLGSLHRRGVVGDDWMWLRAAAIIVFALGLLGLYLLVHPLFAGDRLGALLTAFRDRGVGQVTALGGFAGWFVVGIPAVGACFLIFVLTVFLLMLFGLSARADRHAGISLSRPQRILLKWDERRGWAPWADFRWNVLFVMFALVLVSGSLFQLLRILEPTVDAKPHISQLAATSRNGRVTLHFGLDRNATVRVTLRRSAKTKPLRSIVLAARAGRNVERFAAGHDGAPLRPGRYPLFVSARADRNTSTTSTTLTVP